MLIKLTLEYEGSNYAGWQRQAQHDTIQGRIETALKTIFEQPVQVHGAGRTDTGVHARGQVAAIELPRAFEPAELKRALNALLPDEIVILAATTAPPDFDPRRSARSRVYEYRILNRAQPSVFERRYAWHVADQLALRRMNDAARVFVGAHDFAAFRKTGSEEKSTVRRVSASKWRREDDHLIYRIEANSFLRHQVRTMVGAMVECGRSRLDAETIAAILNGRDRARAPAAAPPHGLYLVEVRY